MLRKVVFTCQFKGKPEYVVEARVHLGTTSARGDNPDEVVSMLVMDMEDCYVTVAGSDWADLAELAIQEARSAVAV